MAYDNSMKGSLFRNERKRDDKDPSHTGSCEVDGKQYWVSAWVKESGPQSKNPGQKFFSLAFKSKDAPPQQQASAQQARPNPAPQPKPQPVAAQAELDDSVPF